MIWRHLDISIKYIEDFFLFPHIEAFQTSGSENVLDTKFDVLRMLKNLELKSLQPGPELSVELYTGQASVNHRRAKFELIGEPVRPRSTWTWLFHVVPCFAQLKMAMNHFRPWIKHRLLALHVGFFSKRVLWHLGWYLSSIFGWNPMSLQTSC